MGLFDFLFRPPDVENLKAKKDVEGLLKALEYKKDNRVRVRAAAALGDLSGPPDVENLKATGDVEGLLKALKYEEKDNDVRQKVIAAIRKLQDKKSVEHLIWVLEAAEGDVREKAAMALGDMGDERSVNPLIYALKDGDANVRENAVAALEAIGDERAIVPLIYVLEDEDENVRENAAMALEGVFRPPDIENLKAKKDVEGLLKALAYEEKTMMFERLQ